MNKPLPWNVKGVGFDAREAARLAAKRAGVPLGEWLNGVISARAAELGVQVDDVEAEDRLEAIAARLSGGADEPAPSLRGAMPEPATHATVAAGRHAALRRERGGLLPSREFDSGMSARSWTAAEPTPAAGSIKMDLRPAAEAQARFAPAASFDGRATARSFDSAEIGRAAPKPIQAGQTKADLLDERLNAILTKLNRSLEPAEAPHAMGGIAVPNRDETPPTDAQPDRAAKVTPAARTLPAEAPPAGPARRMAGAPAAPARDFSDLHAAFRSLAEKLEAQVADAQREASPKAPQPPAWPETQRRAIRSRDEDGTDRRERVAEIRKLQGELAQLAASVAELSPERSLASLDAAVRELAGRIDLSKLDGVQDAVLAPVERLGREMREAIRSADSTEALALVRHDMHLLSAKLDTQLSRGPDGNGLETLRGELLELRGAVAGVADRLSASEQLHDEVSALGERVGTLAERTDPTGVRDLAQAVGDIRELLRGFGSHAAFGALDQKLDTLSARMESLAETHNPETYLAGMLRQIDRAHEALADRLGGGVAPRAALTGLEQSIGTLSAKIDSMGRASHDVTALYGLVGDLADRVQEARDPEAEAHVFSALQSQIGQIMERLDRSDTNTATLHGLERLMGDLSLQIEQSRNTAIDAAENAARAAAQDTLRAAMDNPALNGAELTMQTGLDVDHVSQELAELRRVQEASDRRVTTTLSALNTTLERLVDHMVSAPVSRPAPAEEVEAASKPTRRRRAMPVADANDAQPVGNLPPFDPEQFLLEPGSVGRAETASSPGPRAGAPELRVGGDDAGNVAPLIAAARRAAQAARASALDASLKNGAAEPAAGSQPAKVRSFFANRRRPLLLGLAGIVLLLGTLQIVRLSTEQSAMDAASREPATKTVAPVPTAPAIPEPAPADGVAPKVDKGASLLAPPSIPQAAATIFAAAATDPMPTGTVGTAPSAAELSAIAGLGPRLKDLAMSGNEAAQFEVAARLADGKGVPRDAKLAASWFERAAKQGLAPAQYRLGSIYEKGVGVAADPALALAWYEKAAGQGNVRAMHNLAVMSAEGAGSKPDYGKAVTWFTKAASYGVRDSQYNLAVLFARGLGVTQNLSQSYSWFALAAQQGDGDAVAKRDTVAAKLDPKVLAEAKGNVASFHALANDPAANEVAAPAGGWDAPPAKSASATKVEARVSRM